MLQTRAVIEANTKHDIHKGELIYHTATFSQLHTKGRAAPTALQVHCAEKNKTPRVISPQYSTRLVFIVDYTRK